MHNRKANRLKGYDYSQDGNYFVTICTKDKKHQFGSVENENMNLSKCGEIAKTLWYEIPAHFDHVELDEFVVMPNHIHGIIIIVGNAHVRSLPAADRTKMLLSKSVQQYKAAVSRNIHNFLPEFRWQKSFYDHIIRDEESLYRIRTYIRYNALRWDYDRENDNHINIAQKQTFWTDFLRVQA